MTLTIEDIRNPDRSSGFNGVGFDRQHKTKPYFAQKRLLNGPSRKGSHWFAPHRATAEEAAQDYCDFINSGAVSPATSAWTNPAIEVDMGNTREHSKPVPSDPAVRIQRKVHDGPTDLYDILLYAPDGSLICRKVGVTSRGTNRYADLCVTFGFSIKPYQRAITYKTRAAALAAESRRIAIIAKDKDWTRIRKEAFVPATKGAQHQ